MVCAIDGLPKCPEWVDNIVPLANTPLLRISYTALLYLHYNASSGTLLDILHTYVIFVYFALVPSHALGASTSRAATLFHPTK